MGLMIIVVDSRTPSRVRSFSAISFVMEIVWERHRQITYKRQSSFRLANFIECDNLRKIIQKICDSLCDIGTMFCLPWSLTICRPIRWLLKLSITQLKIRISFFRLDTLGQPKFRTITYVSPSAAPRLSRQAIQEFFRRNPTAVETMKTSTSDARSQDVSGGKKAGKLGINLWTRRSQGGSARLKIRVI